MITLDVEEYCQDCSDFEPEAIKNILYSDNIYLKNRRQMFDTVVTCKYANRCRSMKNYIEEKK